MTRIDSFLLWVGHAGDGRAFHELFERDIRAVVQLAMEEPPVLSPREMIFCRFPLVDGSGNDPYVLRLAVETVARLIDQKVPTLVCCGGGMSRSPLVAAAAMKIAGHGEFDDCLAAVTAHHPADVSSGLWDEVKQMLSK